MANPELNSSQAKIMVVEDSADVRLLFKMALETEGYDVVTASNAQEALTILEGKSLPKLILVDLSLPQMSGEDFVKHLQGIAKFSNMKIILVSGWDDIAKRAQMIGVAGYIRKPVDIWVLLREVRKHLS